MTSFFGGVAPPANPKVPNPDGGPTTKPRRRRRRKALSSTGPNSNAEPSRRSRLLDGTELSRLRNQQQEVDLLRKASLVATREQNGPDAMRKKEAALAKVLAAKERQAAATQKKPPTAQEMAQRVAISRAECAAKNRESVARGRSSTVLATPIRSVRVNVPRVALLPQGAASAAKATPLRAPRSTPVPDSVRACLGKASTLRARVEKAKKQQIMPGTFLCSIIAGIYPLDLLTVD